MALKRHTNDVNEREPLLQTGTGRGKQSTFSFITSPVWWNLLFAVLYVGGQVGQNITLPLWLSEIKGGNPYWVVWFGSIWFTAFFGLVTLCLILFGALPEIQRRISHPWMIVVGASDAINGILVVFASDPTRTAPYLQSILGNFIIPITILCRIAMLPRGDPDRIPSRTQWFTAAAVMVGIFLAAVPTMFNMELPNSCAGPTDGVGGTARILWPMCFMLGFVPAAVMNVASEIFLKRRKSSLEKTAWTERNVQAAVNEHPSDVLAAGEAVEATNKEERPNVFVFLFWESAYQSLIVTALFWTDIIPGFGTSETLSDWWGNFRGGWECFSGELGCSGSTTTRGIVYIFMYIISYIGSSFLLRDDQGANWVAVIQSPVTPLCVLFWSLFNACPFGWHPEFLNTTWWTLGGLALMCPAMVIYHRAERRRDVHTGHGDELEGPR